MLLLQVKVIHEYTATDGDELELKVGDVVLVLAIDNQDELVGFSGTIKKKKKII